MQLGARLRVLHPRDQAKKLAKSKSSVNELRDEFWRRMSVATDIEAVGESVLGAAIAAACEAAVVVIPSQRRNPLREWLMGTQVERLIRLCRTPVLVVKQPTLSSYRRVLIPVQLEAAAAPLIALARALSRGPALEILHVLGTADEIVQGRSMPRRSCRMPAANTALSERMGRFVNYWPQSTVKDAT
jgi:hypothetical protein